MKITINIALVMLGITIFFGGCSKKMDEYNKPAIYWYGKMVHSISNGDLEKADSYYSSLQGEHIASPLLKEATMILAIAHMHDEEYLLSEHFLDEYIKRYATLNEKEFADFLKIKSMYKALPNPRRDQMLIAKTITSAKKFKKNYPNSMYMGMVDTMLLRLQMAQAVLNETIASLYDRLDKPRAARYYRELSKTPWLDFRDVRRAENPWYREWFEGDGTASWYAFMIPDTQSVVSRNTVKNETSKESIKDSTPPWYKSWYNSLSETKPTEDTKMKKEEFEEIQDHSSEQLPLD